MSLNKSLGPCNLVLVTWNPNPTSLGGPSNLLGWLSSIDTGIKGPLWLPLIQPETRCPVANPSVISPIAGKPDCALTMQTGSSFPTYFPAIAESFSVHTLAAILSSTGASEFL